MIKTVIRTRDDMVMVFDETGEQLPQYQGRYEQVRESILADAPEGATLSHWFGYYHEPVPVKPEYW